jgi:PqqD family protein of HPr-rel-A system
VTSTSRCPRVHANVTTREVDEGLLVHDERSGQVHVLNRSAGTVFRLCDGRHSVTDIAATLATGKDVDIGQVTADVEGLLRDFERLGVLS